MTKLDLMNLGLKMITVAEVALGCFVVVKW
ncbi:hypothetical protein Goshw_000129, partial [Gossypium schwendimanii]|nr:hypothetical protein [Gossypium schwendimanii]